MKRIFIVVGVVLGLVGTGAVAAWAGNSGPSQYCSDNNPPGTEHDVVTNPVALTAEIMPDPDGDTYVQGCYSTTPDGSGAPEAAGGVVAAGQRPSGTLFVWCRGDRTGSTVVAVDCDNTVTITDPTSAPGTTASASARVGTVGPISVGRTGAEVDPSGVSPNAPLDGTAGSGGKVGAGPGTCTYVNGGTPTCPFGITVADVTVNESDLVPIVETTSTSPPPPCTGINNDCPGVRVRTQDDPADTVDVNVLGITGVTWDHSLAPQCVQVNSTCP